MGDVIDTFMRPFVGICQAGFVDPCRHGLNAKKIMEEFLIKWIPGIVFFLFAAVSRCPRGFVWFSEKTPMPITRFVILY